MRKGLASLIVAAACLLSACGLGSSAAGPTITGTRVPSLKTGTASFDVVEIDQSAHRLYATDRSDQGVDVFDVSSSTARYLKTIAIHDDPNGLAIASDLGLVFVGTGLGLVDVIDVNQGSPTADTVTKQIATGSNSVDLIDYSPQRHEVFASNGVHGTITTVDVTTGKVTGVLKVGYALEQPRFNPTDGSLYVTSPDVGSLFQLDLATGSVKNKIGLGNCVPTGLAINPKSDQALVACDTSVVWVNLRNPSDIQTFLDVSGADVVSYDAAVDRFLVAAPAAKPHSMVGFFGGSPIAFIGSVDTDAGGHSAAFDETHRLVYTPEVRPGRAGVDSFAMPSGEASLSASWTDLVVFGGLILAIAVVMVMIGRQADPIRRPDPEPRRHRA